MAELETKIGLDSPPDLVVSREYRVIGDNYAAGFPTEDRARAHLEFLARKLSGATYKFLKPGETTPVDEVSATQPEFKSYCRLDDHPDMKFFPVYEWNGQRMKINLTDKKVTGC